MKFTLAAILSAVATAVYAQTAPANAGVEVNAPSLGQVINAGTAFTIKWTVTPNPSANINTITLMSGNSAHLDVITQNILTGPIPVNPPQYVWNIPADTPTMPSYALALHGDNGAVTYSPYFTILGAAPGTNTTAPSSSAAPAASSGAPASSGSVAPSATNASASAAPSKSPSAANHLKAGVACAAGVAGAAALLL